MALLLYRGNGINFPVIIGILIILNVQFSLEVPSDEYLVSGNSFSNAADYVFLTPETHRQRRDLAASAVTNTSSAPTLPISNNTPGHNDSSPTTTETSTQSTTTPKLQPHVPLLGENGTGIRMDPTQTKVSDPIAADGINMTGEFEDPPEMFKAEQNITNLKYDNHTFYTSTFIGNLTYFNEHWANITNVSSDIHNVLSNSHRRATTVTLKFGFPFYGQVLKSLTVATGGFIYTGDHVHNWLAATQYIAPLMANFDTRLTNDSNVKLSDNGNQFSVVWENVTLQENLNKTFTFAVTLYKNGEIIFAYKDIPIPIQNIKDDDHPVKVGISDAYLTDKIMFYLRRKTIYEYDRINFKNHNITNGTMLKLTPLLSCPMYTTCDSCVQHQTSFNCSWCAYTQRCSSGVDRNKQDWVLRNCDKNPIVTLPDCLPIQPNATTAQPKDIKYTTTKNTKNIHVNSDQPLASDDSSPTVPMKTPLAVAATRGHSSVTGVAVAFTTIVLLGCVAAWIAYAFKNPHTRSGQILIKYRPSQWSWKRGEARYTAATIHM